VGETKGLRRSQVPGTKILFTGSQFHHSSAGALCSTIVDLLDVCKLQTHRLPVVSWFLRHSMEVGRALHEESFVFFKFSTKMFFMSTRTLQLTGIVVVQKALFWRWAKMEDELLFKQLIVPVASLALWAVLVVVGCCLATVLRVVRRLSGS
jgi:hypothetical protein